MKAGRRKYLHHSSHKDCLTLLGPGKPCCSPRKLSAKCYLAPQVSFDFISVLNLKPFVQSLDANPSLRNSQRS